MKIAVVLELVLITTLVAYASAKSVIKARAEPVALEATPFRTNVSDATKSGDTMRQDESDVEDVQIVQELGDSQEVLTNPLDQEQSEVIASDGSEGAVSIENNDIDNKPIDNDKPLNENDPNPINKFCTCSSTSCKCCRDFTIPLIPIRGPGCATVRYLDNDRLAISIKYGDLVLASRQVDSRRPTPICLPLPGGYNRFCGRVYGISRQDDDFKACLGLELRADDDVEASLRVSCFKFGPKGLATVEAEPLPTNINDDDDDDDDDDLGLGELTGVEDDDDDDDDEYEEEEAPSPVAFLGDVLGGVIGGGGGGGDDDDFGGFSILGSASDFFTDFFGGDSTTTKSKKKPNEAISIASKANAKPSKKPHKKNADRKKDEETEDNGSVLDVVEETIENLANDDEEEEDETTTITPSGEDKSEANEGGHEQNDNYDDDDDDEEENYDDDGENVDESHKDVVDKTSDEKKTSKNKKKKVSSSYGFDFLGRFFNFFNDK